MASGAQDWVRVFTPVTTAGTLPLAYSVAGTGPSFGQEWLYTLTADARLLAYVGNFTASSTAGNRSVVFLTKIGGQPIWQVPLPLTYITASQSISFCLFPGAVLTVLGNSPSYFYTFPLPNVLMPSGTTIQSLTAGIKSDDLWNGPLLLFSPA